MRRSTVPIAARVQLRIALSLAIVVAGCEPSPREAPRSAVLVTLDTTRADALGCYGGAADTSPRIDAFAAGSVRFARAHTVAPLTLPAHASLLTGLFPLRHGVRDNGRNPLPETAVSVAEVASDSGLQTAAFVSAAVLSRGFGLAQGFDIYRAPGDTGAAHTSSFPSRTAADTVSRAATWLRSRDRERGFLLWVHLWEPHAPYDPPSGFERSNPYLGEIAAADDAFGRLVDALSEQGLDASTTIVLVADHGEAFGEHGERSHGALCFSPTLRVPLIVRTPGVAAAVDDRIVSVADVAPTLLASLGLPVPRGLDGRDLAGEIDAEAGVYFESLQGWYLYGWSPVRGWIDRSGKFWQGGRERFFDPVDDPSESRDLLASGADAVKLAATIERVRASLEQLSAKPRLQPDAPVNPELRDMVEALGYAVAAEGGEDPEADIGRLPDPADRIAELDRVHRISNLGNRAKFAEAAELCEQILGENPGNLWAL
ncbi:MAG: sulfatase, partial [Gaiellales bacterium]